MIDKTKWKIDPVHSEIAFKIKHLMIAHITGRFKNFDADIYISGTDLLTTEINMWIDPASLTTGDEKRDSHIRSKDFFDTETHKQITFISSDIMATDKPNNYELQGNLTIKGITRQIKLNVEFGGIAKDTSGKEKAGFTITGKINRKDWGITWNTPLENGGFLLSNHLDIDCEIELVKDPKQEKKMEMQTSEEEIIIAE